MKKILLIVRNNGGAGVYVGTGHAYVERLAASGNQTGVAGSGATLYASNTSVLRSSVRGLFNDGTAFFVSSGNNRVLGNAVDGVFTSTVILK